MKKQTSEWEKEFGKMFSGVYMRTDPGAHTIDEQIKSFISDLLAKEKMELVEMIEAQLVPARCVTETSGWDTYLHIHPDQWKDFLSALKSEIQEKEEVGG